MILCPWQPNFWPQSVHFINLISTHLFGLISKQTFPGSFEVVVCWDKLYHVHARLEFKHVHSIPYLSVRSRRNWVPILSWPLAPYTHQVMHNTEGTPPTNKQISTTLIAFLQLRCIPSTWPQNDNYCTHTYAIIKSQTTTYFVPPLRPVPLVMCAPATTSIS